MKITILTVGKIKEKYIKEGILEYSKRLSRFCELQIIEVEDEQASENISFAQGDQIKKREAEKLLKKLKDNSFNIVMDIKGMGLDSQAFATKLQGYFNSGVSHITYIIGGSLGLHESILEKANLKLSLSEMTFPHQLTRLILLEQVYRAFKIINGETYHK